VSGPLDDDSIRQQKELAKEIEDLLEKEEIHWSQPAAEPAYEVCGVRINL
jgi:hypothetical protein